jgi:hypothetical protein
LNLTDLMDYARQRYNAVGDPLFPDALLRNYVYDAEMHLAREAKCIRAVYSTTSVASQQEYAFPTRSISIKRVTYNGVRVMPRSLDEVLNLTQTAAVVTGTPYIYAIWAETLYLGPIPAADGATIKVYSFNEPSAKATNSATLDVPDRYHLDIAEFLLQQMCIQDKNYQGASLHAEKWADALRKARATERKMMTGDGFAFTRDEDREFDQLVIG